ncbi:MAG: hypothetical protein IJ565_02620 [Bacilli bacterium]|nr:hypothetical protein [Bacilli bacterium]
MEIILFKKKYELKKSGEQGVLVSKIVSKDDNKIYYIFEPDSFGNGTSNCVTVTEDDIKDFSISKKYVVM